MSNKAWDYLLALLIVVEIILVGRFYLEDVLAKDSIWIRSYPMANQHVEWTGAGYKKLITGSDER